MSQFVVIINLTITEFSNILLQQLAFILKARNVTE